MSEQTSSTPQPGGDVIDAYLEVEETGPMATVTSISPAPSTHQGDVETAVGRSAPAEQAAVESADAPVNVGGVGAINQAQPASASVSGNGMLSRWRHRIREERAAGRTSRVWKSEASSAEAQRLAEVEPTSVIRAQARNTTAADLEALAADPRAEAYANRRARFWLMLMAAVGIALGVAISSSTAQQTITGFMGWTSGFPHFAAYGADPSLGLVLFATLGARILASARGVAIPERARRALDRIELTLFSLVALLNAGPSLGALAVDVLGGQWSQLGPDFMVLVIHLLGPVLVACGVFGVPFMALILAEISAATTAKNQPTAAPSLLVDRRAQVPERFRAELDQVLAAITDGQLPPDPTGAEIYRYLGGGDATKKKHLREAVAGYRPEEVAA